MDRTHLSNWLILSPCHKPLLTLIFSLIRMPMHARALACTHAQRQMSHMRRKLHNWVWRHSVEQQVVLSVGTNHRASLLVRLPDGVGKFLIFKNSISGLWSLLWSGPWSPSLVSFLLFNSGFQKSRGLQQKPEIWSQAGMISSLRLS